MEMVSNKLNWCTKSSYILLMQYKTKTINVLPTPASPQKIYFIL